MALASQIVALALAAAQPAPAAATPPAAAAPAPAAAAPAVDTGALLDLFDRVCLKSGEAPAGFSAAQWSDFPEPLRLMNTYDHGGTFLKSETPAPIFIARTRGGAHMGPGLEARCAVAAQGADIPRIVSTLAERAGASASPAVTMAGVSMTMLIGERGAFTVYDVEDGWVIVRSMDIMIPANMVRPRDLRRRRGDRK